MIKLDITEDIKKGSERKGREAVLWYSQELTCLFLVL
jgi:hypothetical protein